MSKLSIRDVRPEILEFAIQMEEKIREYNLEFVTSNETPYVIKNYAGQLVKSLTFTPAQLEDSVLIRSRGVFGQEKCIDVALWAMFARRDFKKYERDGMIE